MFGYRGNHGFVGALAYGLTGICYRFFGTSSKLLGKILFTVFVIAIPSVLKSCLKGLIELFFKL